MINHTGEVCIAGNAPLCTDFVLRGLDVLLSIVVVEGDVA